MVRGYRLGRAMRRYWVGFFAHAFFPKGLIKSRISILKGCRRMEIVLEGVTGGEGISYDFGVFRVVDNQPFSFDWLTSMQPVQARWSTSGRTTLATTVENG